MFIAKLLIQKGAVVLVRNKAGFTPLDYAIALNYTSLQHLFEKKLNHIIDKSNAFIFFKNFVSIADEPINKSI